MGKRVQTTFPGEITSDYKDRPEGVRVKPSVDRNSVKIHDKQGTVLRVETTIHNPHGLTVFRAKQGDPAGPKSWRILRAGIADLPRRAEISQACNERYLDALAAVDTSAPLGRLLCAVSSPVKRRGQRFRGLRLWDPEEVRLIQAVNRGEHHLRGFGTRDLLPLLQDGSSLDSAEHRRQSARLGRRLRILRAHGLLKKQAHSHRYRLTKKGTVLFTALLAAQDVTLHQLKVSA